MQDVVLESTRSLTQAEFAAWVARRAGEPDRYELLNGRIVMTPPAGYPHGQLEATLTRLVGTFVAARKLGKVSGSSQGFDLPSGDTVAADVTFVSTARWQAAPPPEAGKFLGVVPDLVIEILSASTASRDRGEKKAIYAKNGVTEYWLVDARAREVLVFPLAGDRYGEPAVFTNTDRARSVVLAGLEIDLGELFE